MINEKRNAAKSSRATNLALSTTFNTFSSGVAKYIVPILLGLVSPIFTPDVFGVVESEIGTKSG